MKKLIIATAAVACASVVMAQTVTSQNIVGYTKVAANGGELTLTSINFDTAGATVSSLMSSATPALPDQSKVYVWDKVGQTYLLTSTYSSRSGAWSPDHSIDRGDAFWVEPAGVSSHELIFAGEVNTTEDVVSLAAGVTATGYGYPVDKDFATTEVATAMPDLSYVYRWDAGIQDYVSAQKNARSGWPVFNISPVDGIWLQTADPVTATNSVPFTP